MSVSLNPSSSLGFNRPLTNLVKRSLTITNHNAQAVTFKVKTTAPKLYCVRPNSGKVEPGESVDVSVMLQPMKEDPPLSAKCKDKFLIQSTLITKEKEGLSLADMWSTTDSEETKVHQQKLKVVYLPAAGQTLEEEDEGHGNMSTMTVGDSQYETVRAHPASNGRTVEPIPEFPDEHDHVDSHLNRSTNGRDLARPASPPADFSVANEHSHEDQHADTSAQSVTVPPAMVLPPNPPSPPAPARAPISPPIPAHAPAPVFPEPRSQQPQTDYAAKYADAQAEIKRLQTLLASAATAAASTSAAPELRRRNRALADDDNDSTIAATEVHQTEVGLQPDGVPLQVVVIIAFSVFCVTYLFF